MGPAKQKVTSSTLGPALHFLGGDNWLGMSHVHSVSSEGNAININFHEVGGEE
jgi:hypothetical protein